MRRPLSIIPGRAHCTLAFILACTPRPVPEASSSDSTGPTPETTSTTTATPPTSTTGTPLPEATTGVPFVLEPDIAPDNQACNGFHQLDPECPDGQKCSLDGSTSYTRCVDIVDDPKSMYEPCTVMGDSISGLDDCDLGLICWYVDERGHGTCFGLCDGSYEDCNCADPKAPWPAFCQECAVGFCFPRCDPFLQDCPEGQSCIPDAGIVVCVLDASGDAGAVNDPCEFANECDEGLVCSPTATASSNCDPNATGCCQPFCNTDEMQPCPNPDQSCIQYFPDEDAPSGLENLGICGIPP